MLIINSKKLNNQKKSFLLMNFLLVLRPNNFKIRKLILFRANLLYMKAAKCPTSPKRSNTREKICLD